MQRRLLFLPYSSREFPLDDTLILRGERGYESKGVSRPFQQLAHFFLGPLGSAMVHFAPETRGGVVPAMIMSNVPLRKSYNLLAVKDGKNLEEIFSAVKALHPDRVVG